MRAQCVHIVADVVPLRTHCVLTALSVAGISQGGQPDRQASHLLHFLHEEREGEGGDAFPVRLRRYVEGNLR